MNALNSEQDNTMPTNDKHFETDLKLEIIQYCPKIKIPCSTGIAGKKYNIRKSG